MAIVSFRPLKLKQAEPKVRFTPYRNKRLTVPRNNPLEEGSRRMRQTLGSFSRLLFAKVAKFVSGPALYIQTELKDCLVVDK